MKDTYPNGSSEINSNLAAELAQCIFERKNSRILHLIRELVQSKQSLRDDNFRQEARRLDYGELR